jgi:hypothetical protein
LSGDAGCGARRSWFGNTNDGWWNNLFVLGKFDSQRRFLFMSLFILLMLLLLVYKSVAPKTSQKVTIEEDGYRERNHDPLGKDWVGHERGPVGHETLQSVHVVDFKVSLSKVVLTVVCIGRFIIRANWTDVDWSMDLDDQIGVGG